MSFEELCREVFYKVNLFRDAPHIDTRVYFFEGRHDRLVTASAAMAERTPPLSHETPQLGCADFIV
ncbi:MAG: hypothetical protein ABR526_06685 [Chthoniobacterales bacterium]